MPSKTDLAWAFYVPAQRLRDIRPQSSLGDLAAILKSRKVVSKRAGCCNRVTWLAAMAQAWNESPQGRDCRLAWIQVRRKGRNSTSAKVTLKNRLLEARRVVP